MLKYPNYNKRISDNKPPYDNRTFAVRINYEHENDQKPPPRKLIGPNTYPISKPISKPKPTPKLLYIFSETKSDNDEITHNGITYKEFTKHPDYTVYEDETSTNEDGSMKDRSIIFVYYLKCPNGTETNVDPVNYVYANDYCYADSNVYTSVKKHVYRDCTHTITPNTNTIKTFIELKNAKSEVVLIPEEDLPNFMEEVKKNGGKKKLKSKLKSKRHSKRGQRKSRRKSRRRNI